MKRVVRDLRRQKPTIALLIAFVLITTSSLIVSSSSLYNPTFSFFAIPLPYLILGILCDGSIFLMLGLIIYLVTKKPLLRSIGLGVIFILNLIIIYALFNFTQYYNTYFHPSYISMLWANTGAAQLNKDVAQMAQIKLLKNYKALFSIPIILFSLTIYVLRKHITKNIPIRRTKRTRMIILITIVICALIQLTGVYTYTYYQEKYWRSYSNTDLLGAQIAGRINYFLHPKKFPTNYNLSKIKAMNSNKDLYVNALGHRGSRILTRREIPGLRDYAAYARMTRDKDTLNGIFKDKNVLFIQLETGANFLMGDEQGSLLNDPNIAPNMKKFFAESYRFKNLIHSVAQGHSSDGSFTVYTGVTPVAGQVSIETWNKDRYKEPYTLPRVFKHLGYRSQLFALETADFYRRNNTSEILYGFDDYYYYDPIKTDIIPEHQDQNFALIEDQYFSKEEQVAPTYEKHMAMYKEEIHDYLGLRFLEKCLNKLEKNGTKYFTTFATLKPHVPFFNAPNPFDINARAREKGRGEMTMEGAGYISFINYLDVFFARLNAFTTRHPNTIVVLYADHTPTGYLPEDLAVLFGRELSDAEFAFERAHILGAIHVPDPNNRTGNIKGLLKGTQEHIRSQYDIYRTIIELCSDPDELNMSYYGANLLSNEASYAIDPKNHNVFTDDFTILAAENLTDEDLKIAPTGILESSNTTEKHKLSRSYTPEELKKIWYRIKEFKYNSDKAIMAGDIQLLFAP